MSQKSPSGILYLVPAPLEEDFHASYLPQEITNVVMETNHFVVEDLKSARRFIKKIHKQKNIDACTFYELNEHTEEKNLEQMLEALIHGNSIALVSEAGCPGIADPGQQLVALAHKQSIKVVPLVGPSSILLAMMASGLNGQQFKFNGYLPKEQHARKQKLRELENDLYKTGTSHIFIETPYRNNHLMQDMLETLKSETKLNVAMEIKSANEFIRTLTVGEWKTQQPELGKQNTVFILGR